MTADSELSEENAEERGDIWKVQKEPRRTNRPEISDDNDVHWEEEAQDVRHMLKCRRKCVSPREERKAQCELNEGGEEAEVEFLRTVRVKTEEANNEEEDSEDEVKFMGVIPGVK